MPSEAVLIVWNNTYISRIYDKIYIVQCEAYPNDSLKRQQPLIEQTKTTTTTNAKYLKYIKQIKRINMYKNIF